MRDDDLFGDLHLASPSSDLWPRIKVAIENARSACEEDSAEEPPACPSSARVIGEKGRWVAVAAATVFVLAFVSFDLSASYALSRSLDVFERSFGPIEWERYERPLLAPERNAAEYFKEAARQLDLDAGDIKVLDRLTREPASDWTAEERHHAEQLVGANDAALEVLAEGARVPESNFGVKYRQGAEVMPFELMPLVRLAQVQQLVAILEEGDRCMRCAEVEPLAALATALYRESTLMHVLVAIAIEERMLGLVVASDCPAGGRPERDISDVLGRTIGALSCASLQEARRGSRQMRIEAARGLAIQTEIALIALESSGAENPDSLKAAFQGIAQAK